MSAEARVGQKQVQTFEVDELLEEQGASRPS